MLSTMIEQETVKGLRKLLLSLHTSFTEVTIKLADFIHTASCAPYLIRTKVTSLTLVVYILGYGDADSSISIALFASPMKLYTLSLEPRAGSFALGDTSLPAKSSKIQRQSFRQKAQRKQCHQAHHIRHRSHGNHMYCRQMCNRLSPSYHNTF